MMMLFVANCCYKKGIIATQTDIDIYIKSHPDLPEIDKSCINNNHFEEGMLSSSLILLLGQPLEKELLAMAWICRERWIYGRCVKKVFHIENSLVVGIDEI